LDFYSAQLAHTRHVTSHWIIILIPSILVSNSLIYVFSREAANTNFIVYGFTWPGLEHMIYHTGGEHANHYTTNAIDFVY
jgi:hypothetical protein